MSGECLRKAQMKKNPEVSASCLVGDPKSGGYSRFKSLTLGRLPRVLTTDLTDTGISS